MTLLTPAEVESKILALSDELEDQTTVYRDQCHAAANAEADWKFTYYKHLLKVTDEGPKQSREVREARANVLAGIDLFRGFRLAVESQRATSALLSTLRTRLDAHRTLAANMRSQT